MAQPDAFKKGETVDPGEAATPPHTLADLRRAVKALAHHDEQRAELVDIRDQLIREFLNTKQYSGPQLAKIVGVSNAYLYRIRDKEQ